MSPSSEEALEALVDKIDDLGNGSKAIRIKADIRDPLAPQHIV
jgi:3-oxoacyl-[acyl-carrier protein] reductase